MIADVVSQEWHPNLAKLWSRQEILPNCRHMSDIHFSCTAIAASNSFSHCMFNDTVANLNTVANMAGRLGRQLRGIDGTTVRFHYTPTAVTRRLGF